MNRRYQGGVKQHFFIVSEMNNKVIDVKGGKTHAGTEIVMWDKNPTNSLNQQWYFDENGYIRSALNDMTFFCAQDGHPLKTILPNNDPKGQWRWEGRKIHNQSGLVLDIKGASNHEGAELVAFKDNGQSNQHWLKELVP